MKRILLTILLLTLTAAAQEEQEVAALFALRVGDFEGSQQFLAELSKPTNPYLYGPDGVAPLYLAWGRGQYDRVLAEGSRAADRAQQRGDVDHELALRLLVADAAYRAGLPAKAREQLPRLRAATPGGLRGFLVATMQARDGYLTSETAWDPTPPLTAARAHLKNPTVSDSELIELGLMSGAIGFWQDRLLECGQVQLARELYQTDVLGLKQLVPDSQKLTGAAFWNGVGIYWQTALVTDAVAFDFYRKAQAGGYLEPAQAVAFMRQHVKDLEAQKASIQGKGGLFPCLRHGRLGLALAQAHSGMASALMTVRPLDTEAVLAEIAAAAQEAAGVSDQLLLNQIQLDYVEVLWYGRPGGWEKELDDTLTRLQARWSTSPYRPQQIEASAYLGRLRALQGRKAEAIIALGSAIDMLEAYLVEAGGSSHGRHMRMEFKDVYELLARLQLESGNPHKALEALDREAQLDTVARFSAGNLHPDKPALRKQLARAVELQERVSGLEGAGQARLLAETKEAFYKLLDEIQKSEPSYTRLAVRPNNFSRLQKFVPPGTIIVSIFPSEKKTFLFAMTRGSLKIHEIPVGKAQIDGWVRDFRKEVVQFSRSPGSFNWKDAAIVKPLDSLSQALLAPLEADLQGQTLIAFIPTGSLHYFPLQCLLVGKPGGARPTLLIEKYQVIHLTKSSDMDSLMLPPNTEVDTLTALADPDGSLSGARTEAGALAKVISKSKIYVGAEATPEHLQALEQGTDFVHLATHGILDCQKPTDSYLLMAGQKGKITVSEIAGLDLTSVRLVTLSACQTALADRAPEVGSDLSSLADAFGFAGSPSLVASLWKVDDTATSELMCAFYKSLSQNVSRGESIQAAQVAMLNRPERTHPYYWASFILVGDWR